MNPIPTVWVTATLPKAGNRAEENEDAVAADAPQMRFAISDGASEGWQSRAWARRLATGLVRRPPTPADFPAWIAAARQWSPPANPAGAPWYAEQKREQGSFATILGLEIRQPRTGTGLVWRAVAIGDSCLFVVRAGQPRTSFPITTVEAFGNRPVLVPSNPATPCPTPEWLAGRVESGDLLVLATDAVAKQFMGWTSPRAWEPVYRAVGSGSGDPAPLLDWLVDRQAELRDDATVVVIRVPASLESPS